MRVRLGMSKRLELSNECSGRDGAAHWIISRPCHAGCVGHRLVVDGDDDAGDSEEEATNGADIHGPEENVHFL